MGESTEGDRALVTCRKGQSRNGVWPQLHGRWRQETVLPPPQAALRPGSPGWAFPEPGDGRAQEHRACYKGPRDQDCSCDKRPAPASPHPTTWTPTQAHPAGQGPLPPALGVGDLPRPHPPATARTYHSPAHRTPLGHTGGGRSGRPKQKSPQFTRGAYHAAHHRLI